MEEIEDWLRTKGRLIPDALAFVEDLCHKMIQSGIPISRVRIGFRTLHPQMEFWAYTWTESEDIARDWGGRHGISNSPSYFGSPAEWVHQNHKTFRKKLTTLDPETDHPVLFEQAEAGLTDYIMMPLDFSDGTAAVISFVTRAKGGFSQDNSERLEKLIGTIGPIIEVHATRKIAVTLLNTYIGHRSGEKVMSGNIKRGDGEDIEAALWFCDLRNYTALSEHYNQREIFDLLNDYFQTISDIIQLYDGEILKFIGDAVLIIFPVDKTITPSKACNAALSAAQDSLLQFENQNKVRHVSQKPLINFGIGLHFGHVTFGNVGAINRLDFTVMGQAVNLTSRLEQLTKRTGDALLMSQDFSDHLDRETRCIGEFSLKGIDLKQSVFALPQIE